MNYQRIYSELILRAKNRSILVGHYTEKHHILPKSMYQEFKNEKWNIVRLFPEEHYMAHKLLYKIYKNKEMLFSLNAMYKLKNNKTKRNISNKYYGSIRTEFIKYISNYNKIKMNELCDNGLTIAQNSGLKIRGENNGMFGMVGDKNPFYKKQHSDKTKEIISDKAKKRGNHNEEHKKKISNSCRKPKKSKENYSKFIYEFYVDDKLEAHANTIKDIKYIVDTYPDSPSYYKLQYNGYILGKFELRKVIKS